MKYNLLFFSIAMFGLLTMSCGDSPDNATEIQNYITENNLNALEIGDTGLFYVVTKEGNGEFPTLSDEVTVHYEGTFLDGQVFDSSYQRGTPLSFPLTNVIVGWQIGIPKFSKGGGGILIIPSDLGYGERGSGSIPGNSVLLFEVELLDF